MKNFIFALFANVVLLSSCHKSDLIKTVENQKPVSMSTLDKELDAYILNFMQDYSVVYNPAPKASAAWWVLFAVADYEGGKYGGRFGSFLGGVHGAVAGAITGGILLSGCYAYVNNGVVKPYNTVTSIPQIVGSINDQDKIGLLHNYAINELLEKKTQFVTTSGVINFRALFGQILKFMSESGFSYAEIAAVYRNEAEYYNLFKTSEILQTKTYSAEVIDRSFAKLAQKFSEDTLEISMAKKYIVNAVKIHNINSLRSFSSGFEKIIKDSAIEEGEKSQLLLGIAIGKNSQAYWMEQHN